MTGLFRLLFIIFLIFLVRLVMYRLFGQKSSRKSGARRSVNQNQARTISGSMVKDPQCGTYVASELAVPLRTGGRTYYFCSQSCLEEFKRLRSSEEVRVPAGHA